MDKNSAIGFALIAALLIGYNLWTAPTEQEMKAHKAKQDSIAAANTPSDTLFEEQTVTDTALQKPAKTAPVKLDSLQLAAQELIHRDKYGVFAKAAKGSSKTFTLENNKLSLTFHNKGAGIVDAELKNFKTHDSLPLYLFAKELSNMK